MKILVVGPSWVGDMVMAQSLFKLLKRLYPECAIDVLAPEWSHPVLARMSEVRKALSLSLKHGELGIASRWRLGRDLVNEGYTRAIVLPRSWKSALIPFAAKVPVRTGFHGEQRYFLLNDRRQLDKSKLDQTVKRFVALGVERHQSLPGDWLTYPSLHVDTDNQHNLLTRLGLQLDRPAVAMMPGAEYGPAKQWPVEYYQKLAGLLVDAGRQVWILGSQKDTTAGSQIASMGLPWVFDLCGKTQLVDAVDLLALTESAVTNDSGLMHVAAAVGTRVHALYGSSTPDYTPPLTDKAVVHWLQLECSPCFKRCCPLGHLNCLKEITPELVLKGMNLS